MSHKLVNAELWEPRADSPSRCTRQAIPFLSGAQLLPAWQRGTTVVPPSGSAMVATCCVITEWFAKRVEKLRR